MIKIASCPVCNSVKFDHFLTCVDHSITGESFSISKCQGCQLLITSPLPSVDEIGRYYQSITYTSHAVKPTTILDKIYFSARTFTLKWKLGLINNRIPKRVEPNGKLLDVGCGTGEFLKAAKQAGWHVFGSEPSAEARSKADSLIAQSIKPSLSIVRNIGNTFDVITLWHVLEHIEKLNDTIEELKEVLTLHGSMYIAVPNHQSWDSQYYHDYWAAYDVPRHIWHFNIHNINQLMAKHGLIVTEIIPMRLDAFYVSLLSEKYLAGKKLSLTSLMKALVNGARSNYNARKTMEYSSLIYVVKHATR